MMKKLYVFAVVSIAVILQVLLFSDTGTASSGVVTIAEDGQAVAEIVVPANPPYIVKLAAEELKHYLDKITGGDFKITSRPGGRIFIRLGESEEAQSAGLDPSELRRDGFYISAESNNIFIVGADNPSTSYITHMNIFYYEPKRATLLGVYEFLEQLGVRWPAPGPDHEVVPSRPTVEIAEGMQKIEPFFPDRQLGRFWGFSRFPDSEEYVNEENPYIYLWGLRLKLSGRYVLYGSHSERALLGTGREEGDIKNLWASGHPERLALNPYRDESDFDGERILHFSCWTDPGVLETWKRAADGYFSGKTPREAGFLHLGGSWPLPFRWEDEFMIDPMDHFGRFDGRCRCDRCSGFREKYPAEDDTEIFWRVIAGVAEYIGERHPGKYITTLVYPPKMGIPEYTEVPDNVRVRICVWGPVKVPTPAQLESELNLIRAWSAELGDYAPPLWTYQTYASHGRRIPGAPETYPRLIAEFLKITRNDIAGMFLNQTQPNHTCKNLDTYITARLLWDPDRDIEEELAEYFRAYYGPAAEPAQRLFDRFEDNWINFWKLIHREDRHAAGAVGFGSPAEELRKLLWTEIYCRDEMDIIEGIITDIEETAAEDPVYCRRAGLLRAHIFNVMKMERAEVLADKEEILRDFIAHVPVLSRKPAASDWKSAPEFRLVSARRMQPELTAPGKFKLLSHEGILFLRAELEEPGLADSLTKKDRARGDSRVWRDNDIEMFFYSEKSQLLWQVIVNDQGNWASQKIMSDAPEWSRMEGFRVEVAEIPGGWTAEAEIPVERLGKGELRFNVTRSRQIKGELNELSTWSPLGMLGGWHIPGNYGHLVFTDGKQ